MIKWLPALVIFKDYDNDWNNYLNAIYNFFKDDFVDHNPTFKGIKLRLKRHPLIDGKEATFWHFISKGRKEDERCPDMRRCERIRWPKPIIENAQNIEIKIWENNRKGERRILLLVEKENYLIVLNKRKKYILPWTAYYIEYEHQKQKLLKEWKAYKKTGVSG